MLTTEDILGDRSKITVSFDPLAGVVNSVNYVFTNDGIVQLEMERSEEAEVFCKLAAGGELRSRKGVNLPTANLGISAFLFRSLTSRKAAVTVMIIMNCVLPSIQIWKAGGTLEPIKKN